MALLLLTNFYNNIEENITRRTQHYSFINSPSTRTQGRIFHIPRQSATSQASSTRPSTRPLLMIRHSISQIFTSNTPHEQHSQTEGIMISSLQPSRPRAPVSPHNHPPTCIESSVTPVYVQVQTQPPPPLNQQPMRQSSSAPRNQIEAMPPFQSAALPIIPRPLPFPIPAQTILDSSVRHPVFFTDRLIRAPTGVNAGNTSWGSPVTVGYVFEDGVRREGAARL